MKTWAGVVAVAYASVGILLAVGFIAHNYASRSKDAMSPAAFTATMSAIAALLFSVLMNGVIGSKRDYDARIANARREHLERLRPILKTDGQEFAQMAARLRTHDALIDLKAWYQERFKPEEEGFWETIYQPPVDRWQSGDPLAADLAHHFPEYAERRAELKSLLAVQDNTMFALAQDIVRDRMAHSTNPTTWYTKVAIAIIQRCMGKAVDASVTPTKSGDDYHYILGDEEMVDFGRTPNPVHVANVQAFSSFEPSPAIREACERLKTQGPRLAAKAAELATIARQLAEQMDLPGTCNFLRPE